jgi:ADP-ribosyl-[dinitrogen reductase] hydrolase
VSRLPTADGDERVTATAVALARVVAALIDGAPPEEALDGALAAAADRDAPAAVRTALAAATDGATVTPGGGPVGTLETALHDGLTAHDAEAAAVAAVNRGGETTAAGAAAGAVAGARFGAAAVPERWLDSLDGGPLREAARALLAGSAPDA